MGEEHISRTTLYLPKYLHNAAKEANLNFSKEFTRYLETILFGEESSDLGFQLDKIRERKKTLQIELTSLNTREKELVKLLKDHDVKVSAEKNLYDKFIRYMNGRISNAKEAGTGIDLERAAVFLKQDYFPKNGLGPNLVEEIINRVDNDCFDFDCFKTLRKGGSFEDV